MKKKIRAKYPTLFYVNKKGRDNKDYYNTSGIQCECRYTVSSRHKG